MKKNCLLIVLIGILCTNLFSQSYDERRIFFGENYQTIQKVSKENETIISNSYSEVLAFANKVHTFSDFPLVEYSIYKESYNSFVFYRFLFTSNHEYAASFFDYLQIFCLVYKNKLYVLDSSYLHKREFGDGTVRSYDENIYSNYAVIQEKGVCEIIMHRTKDRTDSYDDVEGNSGTTVKVSGNGEAYFYKMSDVLKRIEKTDAITQVELKEYKSVYCGRTLIDAKRPFMYTIQNAFDKNPETSYVENSENNEITISISSNTKVKQVGIINGFVKTPNLYASNNRIKKIAINDKIFELNDVYSKDFVFFSIPGSSSIYIKTVALYKGKHYPDTCIAEIQIE